MDVPRGRLFRRPEGFTVSASTDVVPVAAFENDDKKLYGVQYHPEVMHSTHGQQVLEHFLYRGAGLTPTWTTGNVIEEQVEAIREQVGTKRAICGLSGGVDSAVAAALVQKAIGSQLTCVYVDHGLMRKGETEQVEKDFVAATGVQLKVVDAEDRFLTALKGVSDPEEKRKIIGREFIRVFEQAQAEIIAEAGESGEPVQFLVQGTLYPDVVESGGGTGTANIKSHHNVGGLPEDLEFQLIEPLRKLFKDEVRMVGQELGLPEEIVQRQPFPGPGLGIRIVGEVTKERLDLLREADAIAREELTAAGLDREIWQCPVVLLADVRSVGVQGDGRTYGHPIVLRPVSSEDAMTADWSRLPYDVLGKISTRITNEVRDVNRVVLDVTSKPPGTIEWSDPGDLPGQVRLRVRTGAPGFQISTTRQVSSSTWVLTTSVSSVRKRWNGSGGSASFTYPAFAPGSVTSIARPPMRTSPPPIPVPGPGLAWSAKRGSRLRSSALSESGIMPSHSSPSRKRTSRPVVRGEPSLRRVART